MIRTLIFDFAGVLTKTRCFPQVAANLGKQFAIDPHSIEKRLYGTEKAYVLGKESTRDFWKKSCSELGIPFDDFVNAFRSWYELDPDMLACIKELKKKYQIILHSDNFEIVSAELRQNPILTALFERMFFSNEMHLSKRDERAFQYVLATIQKAPAACLFIDDKEQNLVAPANIGMKTIKYENMEQCKKALAAYGITVSTSRR